MADEAKKKTYTVEGFLSVILPPSSKLNYRVPPATRWETAASRAGEPHRFTAHGGEELQGNGGPEESMLADLVVQKLIKEA